VRQPHLKCRRVSDAYQPQERPLDSMLRLPGRLSELCKDTTSHVPSQTNVQYGVSMEQVCLKIGRISHCQDLEGFALPRNLGTARAWCLSIIYGIVVEILEDSKILSGGPSRGPLFCSGSNRLATAAWCSMLHSQHCSQPNRLTCREGIRKPIS
jgi:hypothetical protein